MRLIFPRLRNLQIIYTAVEHEMDIICQCEHGQSRSAACAAAIKEHFEKSGIDFAVLVPVIRCYVLFGIHLTVIHKGDNIALFDAVAARFLARAGMGDEIKLKKIERRALADVACYTHLLLVHDLRVLFEFFRIVFHDEAPFIFAVRKGCSV